ncbi:pimeloyl-ACP methyl ester carboxylesterase [Bradyrhizobium japonicum USDA 38]|uniref:lipase family protein n=1 Tax=Bradyrhizobium japonicum TaxID=375 RepID=UPI001364A6CD|nr:lipase family protein [Bradyrhizobium japonicum]MCS3898027.1 pimeloyl-ACP methyl ester carboxylesterase [Bradyrhizobium japonicum USDA 38]MCW2216867.1 pimeloyl-ACP methyl ester carboxylesterase [Bradyrhizobium japonicum]MCW2341483.1 pimeloyl-ACP methyl ester carboxylesterase [Bradyrhizobium japonicum]
MSFLVRFPRASYRADALDGFTVTPDFTPGNAQAMMWLSQLAYETDDRDKVDNILKALGLEMRGFGADTPATGLVPPKARFIVAVGRGATFVTLSGTDPLSIKDWITNFTLALRPNVLHKGFAEAVDAVRSDIEVAIRSGGAGQPLFFTGHSMGGALANIAALRALDAGLRATAIYTFGGPRTGGQDFFEAYEPLGESTFRLVNGNDIVPAVPPSPLFRHVGQMLRCASGSTFAGQVPESKEGNDPSPIQVGLSTLLTGGSFHLKIPSIEELSDIDPRTLDQSDILPGFVRDHVPASYFRALSVTIP